MLRRFLSRFVVIVFAAFISLPAQALVEARLHLGYQKTDYDFNAAAGATGNGALKLDTLPAFGFDVIVDLPLMPVGIGLRHEQMGGGVSPTGFDIDIKSQRQALLINKRFLDFIGYFGVIGSLGLIHSNSYSLKVSGVSVYDEKPKTDLSYSIGVEGGANLLGFQVGAEVGYLNLKLKGNVQTVDLSGVYGKIIVGMGF